MSTHYNIGPMPTHAQQYRNHAHPRLPMNLNIATMPTKNPWAWVVMPTIRNDAHTSASFLFERIMMKFGCRLELVSVRGTHFLNEVISNLTARYDIKHQKTTPYNPKANGLTERANGIVGNIFTKVVSAHKTDWDENLHSAVYAYNTSHKTTTGRSVYFLVYGQGVHQNVGTEIETLR